MAVFLFLSRAAGAGGRQQKSIVVGGAAGCCAVDCDIAASVGVDCDIVTGIIAIGTVSGVGEFASVFIFRLPFYEFRDAGNGG